MDKNGVSDITCFRKYDHKTHNIFKTYKLSNVCQQSNDAETVLDSSKIPAWQIILNQDTSPKRNQSAFG